MITPMDVYRQSRTEKKRTDDMADPFSFYLMRPISYVITAPLLSLGVSATQATAASMLIMLLSIFVISFSQTLTWRIIGGVLWAGWAILDFVDGNIARYTKTASQYGALWDAAGGYIAVSGWPLAVGFAAYYDSAQQLLPLPIDPVIYAFLGGATGILALYPRVLMHKAYRSMKNESGNTFQDKSTYGFLKRAALVLTDPVFLPLVFYFVSCFLHIFNIMIIGYAFVMAVICVISCAKIFKSFSR